MHHTRLFLMFFVAAHFCRYTAGAQGYFSYGLSYDNDQTLEKVAGLDKLARDRNYTTGAGFFFSDTCMRNWGIFRGNNFILKILGLSVAHASRFNSMLLGNTSFTPDDLSDKFPIKNDRPYSSINYIQSRVDNIVPGAGRMHSISLNIGVLGTDVTRELQTAFHEAINYGDTRNPRTPRGWQYQVSDGGAPTALVTWQETYLLTKKHQETPRYFGGELKAAWTLNAGWYNAASAEASYRFGMLDGRCWTYTNKPVSKDLPAGDDSDTNGGSSTQTEQPVYERAKRGELYLFGTLRGNLVGYNVLLSGQGGGDAVTIPNGEVKHGVLDGSAGVCVSPVLCAHANADLKAKFNFRSPEFEAPGREPRWHYWMSLELDVTDFW